MPGDRAMQYPFPYKSSDGEEAATLDTLIVNGPTTLNGPTTINGPETLNGDLTVNGNELVTGNLTVDGTIIGPIGPSPFFTATDPGNQYRASNPTGILDLKQTASTTATFNLKSSDNTTASTTLNTGRVNATDLEITGPVNVTGTTILTGDLTVTGTITGNTGPVSDQFYSATDPSNQYRASNPTGILDLKQTASTTATFNLKSSDNTTASTTLNTGHVNSTYMSAATTYPGTVKTTQTNTSTSSAAESGFSAINDAGTGLDILMSGSNNTNLGLIRTASTAFGMEMETQGSGKYIKLVTNGGERIAVTDTTNTLTNSGNEIHATVGDNTIEALLNNSLLAGGSNDLVATLDNNLEALNNTLVAATTNTLTATAGSNLITATVGGNVITSGTTNTMTAGGENFLIGGAGNSITATVGSNILLATSGVAGNAITGFNNTLAALNLNSITATNFNTILSPLNTLTSAVANVISATGPTGTNTVTAAGASGQNIITAAGESGANIITASGLNASNAINTLGVNGINTISAEGADGGNFIEALGATGTNTITASGASATNIITAIGATSSNLISATGATGTNTMTAEGAAGLNYILAVGSAGQNFITAGGADGQNILTASGLNGQNIITATGAEAANEISAVGASAQNFITTVGANGITTISASGASGENIINAIGANAINTMTATGASAENVISAIGANGVNTILTSGLDGTNVITATGASGVNTISAIGENATNVMTAAGALSSNTISAVGAAAFNTFSSVGATTITTGGILSLNTVGETTIESGNYNLTAAATEFALAAFTITCLAFNINAGITIIDNVSTTFNTGAFVINGDGITVNALAGANNFFAGVGANTLSAVGGLNLITAGVGTNTITALGGINNILAGAGYNNMGVTIGNNTISSGAGNNFFTSTSGNNIMAANTTYTPPAFTAGNNYLIAYHGLNKIWGTTQLVAQDNDPVNYATFPLLELSGTQTMTGPYTFASWDTQRIDQVALTSATNNTITAVASLRIAGPPIPSGTGTWTIGSLWSLLVTTGPSYFGGDVTITGTLTAGSVVYSGTTTGTLAVTTTPGTTLTVASTSLSSSPSTGAETIVGGLGIGANLTVGGAITPTSSTVSSGVTLTLTAASAQQITITGTSTQLIILPDATTLAVGRSFAISNTSTGLVTVQKNGGGALSTVPTGSNITFTVLTIATAPGTWAFADLYSLSVVQGKTLLGDGVNVASLTASQAVVTDASKNLASLAYTSLAASPSTIMSRDTYGNTSANSFIVPFRTIVTSGVTVTLTIADPEKILLTGSSTQILNLPNATTLTPGQVYTINNNSSGGCAVQTFTGGALGSVGSGAEVSFTVFTTGTTAGTWDSHAALPSNVVWGTTLLTTSSAIQTSATLASTVATGTAPLSVASTTVVPNLNVSLLLGSTWAAPGSIGSGTPAAGAFTSLGASGAVTQTGGGAGSFTAVATTGTQAGITLDGTGNGAGGNAWKIYSSGATSSLVIADITSSTTAITILSSGRVNVSAGVASTSTTTGTLVVTGGVGISDDLWVGSTINSAGVINQTNGGAGAFTATSTSSTIGITLDASGTASGKNWTMRAAATTNALRFVNQTDSILAAEFTGTGTINFPAGVAATSATTGTVVVTGGAGISGDLWVGGTINGTLASGSAGAFTTLSNTTAAGSTINAASIGATTKGSGAFTTLSNTTAAGSTINAASIGATTTGTILATTIGASGQITQTNGGNAAFNAVSTSVSIGITLDASGTASGKAWVIRAVSTLTEMRIENTTDSIISARFVGTGQINFPNAIAATSTSTGTLTTSGGISTSLGNWFAGSTSTKDILCGHIAVAAPQLSVSPQTNGTQSTIRLYQNTAEGGAYWNLTQNADVFSIYSSTLTTEAVSIANTGAVTFNNTIRTGTASPYEVFQYSEAGWTPALRYPGLVGTTPTTTVATGYYARCGKKVTASFKLEFHWVAGTTLVSSFELTSASLPAPLKSGTYLTSVLDNFGSSFTAYALPYFLSSGSFDAGASYAFMTGNGTFMSNSIGGNGVTQKFYGTVEYITT